MNQDDSTADASDSRKTLGEHAEPDRSVPGTDSGVPDPVETTPELDPSTGEPPATADSSPDVEETVATDTCALPGCDNPIPAPTTPQDGRRRKGRPSRYCCKAHADAASRQRRARDVAAVADPLDQVRALAEAVVPGTVELMNTLRELLAKLEQAQSGALARVQEAEADAERARRDVEHAQKLVETAERHKDQALEQARKDREGRKAAEVRATEQAHDAERVRKTAWEQVAEHERARGRAEAAQAAAEEVRDRTIGRLREAQEQADALAVEHKALASRLTQTEQALSRTVTDAENLRYRSAELRSELDQHRVRAEQVEQELTRVTQKMFEQREAAHRAQEQLTTAHREQQQVADRLAQTEERLHQLLAAGLRDVTDPQPGGWTAETCPACGTRAQDPEHRRRLRRELGAIWFEPATDPTNHADTANDPQDRTRALRVRRCCASCAPRVDVTAVACLSCGELVRAVTVPEQDLRVHLDTIGWRTTEHLSDSLCPACARGQEGQESQG